MNKDELISAVSTHSGMSKTDSKKITESVLEVIGATLKKGEEVRLVGFGTFSVAKREASEGRNPRTGEKILIKAAKVPKFKAGKGLKETVDAA